MSRLYACDSEGCERQATYFGLARGRAFCPLHFPEHVSELQRALNGVVEDIHKAFDAVSSVAYSAVPEADTMDVLGDLGIGPLGFRE